MVSELIRRRAIMVESGLPYDAKIEYLEFSGEQYCSTGYIGKPTMTFAIDFSYTVTTGFCVAGRGAAFRTEAKGYSGVTHYYFGASKTRNNAPGRKTVTLSPTGVTIGTTFYAYDNGAIDPSMTTIDPILVGWNNTVQQAKLKGKVYGVTIYDNDSLVCNLIPVRVGQVGYMYDTISGELFGNLGTGSFILGNDINT